MKEIEDRQREDAYRKQKLGAEFMDAVKLVLAGAGPCAKVRKRPHWGAMVPVQEADDRLVAKWHFDKGSGNIDNGVVHGASMPGLVVMIAIIGLLAAYMRREKI